MNRYKKSKKLYKCKKSKKLNRCQKSNKLNKLRKLMVENKELDILNRGRRVICLKLRMKHVKKKMNLLNGIINKMCKCMKIVKLG